MPRTFLAATAAFGLVACSEECPDPGILGGKVFTIHNTVVATDPATVDASFPGESSPANGEHTMSITWNSPSLESAITVGLDGQTFPGQGVWNDVECGNFGITWEGNYVSEDGLVQHDFSATAQLQTWEGALEGEWVYVEIWREGEASGRVNFDVQMLGSI